MSGDLQISPGVIASPGSDIARNLHADTQIRPRVLIRRDELLVPTGG